MNWPEPNRHDYVASSYACRNERSRQRHRPRRKRHERNDLIELAGTLQAARVYLMEHGASYKPAADTDEPVNALLSMRGKTIYALLLA